MANGYLKVAVYQHQTYVHHIVWYMTYGVWPQAQIDHANGDRTDNRIGNLRIATQTEQNFNMKTRIDNTTGVKGVALCSKTGRYRAYITLKQKQFFLGNHESFDAAVAARRAAEVEYCGEFIRVVSPSAPQETSP
jgi:hypothetical protein